jgi:drug/metabolite transporter (DMT)-like permease
VLVQSSDATDRRLGLVMPPAFVVLWATGFIVARLVAPFADPVTFLVLRCALASTVMACIAALFRVAWPRTLAAWRDPLIAGALLHGVYLSAVFWAVKHGLPAGIAALLAGLQPLLTALLSGPVLGERVSARRWAGIMLGFAGAALVIAGKLDGQLPYSAREVAVCFAGVLCVTAGTLWQKRTGHRIDLRTGTAIQYLGALAIMVPLALLTESGHIEPVPEFWIGLVWAVFGLSIGAVGLLLILIRRGAVAGVAALMYLVPPVSALMGYALFGETLGPVQIGGMVLATVGVAVASRG